MALLSSPPSGQHFTLNSCQARMFFEGALDLGSTTASLVGMGAAPRDNSLTLCGWDHLKCPCPHPQNHQL